MRTITVDNRDTLAHIDTYHMLTGESWQESEIDYQREQSNNDTLDYDSFNWELDHAAIVRKFAEYSLEYVIDQVKEYAGVVVQATLKDTGSPKYYNYTTDWYIYDVEPTAELIDALKKHYDANKETVNTRIDSYGPQKVEDGPYWVHAAWCDMVDKAISNDNTGIESSLDDYNTVMWEIESEVYTENVTVTKL